MMNLSKKKEIADAMNEKFSKAEIIIVTDYKGLDVVTMNDLRRKLRAENVEYRVVKNSLLVRASEGTDAGMIKEFFKGPTAVALSYEDPVAPAKVLTDFIKTNDKVEIKAGAMKGRMLDVNAIKALSALPSHEILLSQFLSVMNAVPTSLVRALSDMPRQLLNVLNAIKEQKEAA